MAKQKVRRDLEPDGKLSQSDALESLADFSDEYEDMSEEFFKTSNPGYYAMLQRLKNGSNKDST